MIRIGIGPDNGPNPQVSTLSYAIVSASGTEIGLPGRILAGLLLGRNRNGPSGRPKAGRSADFGAFPVAVRPKSDPEHLPIRRLVWERAPSALHVAPDIPDTSYRVYPVSLSRRRAKLGEEVRWEVAQTSVFNKHANAHTRT